MLSFRMKLTNLLSNKTVRILGFFLLLGIAYAIIVRYTSFCIPCFFNLVTGLRCPGCGITHVFLCLMNFDFAGAFHANAFLFTTSPLLLVLVVLNVFCSEKIKKLPVTRWLTTFYLFGVVVWAVVRNILKI